MWLTFVSLGTFREGASKCGRSSFCWTLFWQSVPVPTHIIIVVCSESAYRLQLYQLLVVGDSFQSHVDSLPALSSESESLAAGREAGVYKGGEALYDGGATTGTTALFVPNVPPPPGEERLSVCSEDIAVSLC